MIFGLLNILIIIVLLVSVITLYYNALRTLRRKAHQVTRNVINQSRALSKAAHRVSVCLLVLTVPMVITFTIQNVNIQLHFANESSINVITWFAYISFLGNAFCSSVIFMSQNRPIRRLIRRLANHNWNRIRSAVGTLEGTI